MEVNKKQLADIFGASIRTIQNWQEQGMPVLRGGGKGNEVLYDSAAVIKWYAERDAEIENEKLRREVEELRQASETDLQPGTIEYERHRLTRAQADAQELKNARDSAEVVETAFCTFVLSRIAGEIASILDGIPLSVQRRFPELENRHVDFLKRDIIKAMNKAAALDELITDNKGKKHDVLTGSDDGRHSNTSLAWGAGVQFNPTESVAIDIAYEGSGSGDWRTDGFIVGVGYKF
ncbi:hypothetical protein DLY88_26765 [Escherichia coli]|uniref:Ail/Lom family outer membrane beta-barrel protein n=6 Tax=Escherichia coli TaxID=562 RepID=UPI0019C7E644|nr:Ail/Lom family outer membrane beta-barrel protein [Escherichia coli]EFN4862373.1 outer membrane beta-barrel protein [Escherichia coli]EGE3158461.1 hypothetical protein [Escherichia coli]EGE3163022.1 hypothetical protein [Escherichia coli]MCD9238664.1 terminase small subunit [Escherichia coli]